MKDKTLHSFAVASLRANRIVSPPHHIAHIIKNLTWHSFLPALSFFRIRMNILYWILKASKFACLSVQYQDIRQNCLIRKCWATKKMDIWI
jgi:hypothetical protein